MVPMELDLTLRPGGGGGYGHLVRNGGTITGRGALVIGDVVCPAGWQARYVVTWPASAATTPRAVVELMFLSRQTRCCKVLELNVVTASRVKAVCRFPDKMKGAQGKKRAEVMFGVAEGLHPSWSYQMYHKEDRRSVWYGLRGPLGVGGDEVPRYVGCMGEGAQRQLGGWPGALKARCE